MKFEEQHLNKNIKKIDKIKRPLKKENTSSCM